MLHTLIGAIKNDIIVITITIIVIIAIIIVIIEHINRSI